MEIGAWIKDHKYIAIGGGVVIAGGIAGLVYEYFKNSNSSSTGTSGSQTLVQGTPDTSSGTSTSGGSATGTSSDLSTIASVQSALESQLQANSNATSAQLTQMQQQNQSGLSTLVQNITQALTGQQTQFTNAINSIGQSNQQELSSISQNNAALQSSISGLSSNLSTLQSDYTNLENSYQQELAKSSEVSSNAVDAVTQAATYAVQSPDGQPAGYVTSTPVGGGLYDETGSNGLNNFYTNVSNPNATGSSLPVETYSQAQAQANALESQGKSGQIAADVGGVNTYIGY